MRGSAIVRSETIRQTRSIVSTNRGRPLKKLDDIWERKAAAKDYQAAHEYLTLLFSESQARLLVRKLRAAPTTKRQAKDLLRASQTHLLEKNNPHVADDLKNIKKDKKLSPVLLVRGDGNGGITLTIADGDHRICASWYWNEDVPVACCIVDLPRRR